MPLSPRMLQGANCYFLLDKYMAGDEQVVRETFNLLRSSKCKVLRTWCFSLEAILPSTDVIATALARLLDDAHNYNLHVILTLTDYWLDLPRYVAWAAAHGDELCRNNHRDAFFASHKCRERFLAHISAILSRFASHPAFFAVDLCNEPRCERDPTGETFLQWLRQTAAHTRHVLMASTSTHRPLITIGLEGFDAPGKGIASTPCWARSLGVPWCEAAAYLDVASFHLWPDQWWDDCQDTRGGGGEQGEDEGSRNQASSSVLPHSHPLVARAQEWIREHCTLLASIYPGKPLWLTEYGSKGSIRTRSHDAPLSRQDYFAALGRICAASQSSPLQVACCWMAAGEGYPDYDGYTVYDAKTLAMIVETEGEEEGVG